MPRFTTECKHLCFEVIFGKLSLALVTIFQSGRYALIIIHKYKKQQLVITPKYRVNNIVKKNIDVKRSQRKYRRQKWHAFDYLYYAENQILNL